VRTLANAGAFAPGEHALVWDHRDDAGAPLPAGVYFVRVRAGAESAVRRVVMLR
jgi:hypothetical protein